MRDESTTVAAQLEEVSRAVRALRKPPFKISEIFDFLREVIETVEAVGYDKDLTGPEKHQIAREVFDYFDDVFGMTILLRELVQSKVWILRWIPGDWIGKVIDVVLDLAIKAIVAVLNATLWKRNMEDLETV